MAPFIQSSRIPADPTDPQAPTTGDGHVVLVRVKVVPGARQDGLAGALGDRIKIRTAAPPEGGKANKAVQRIVARALGIRPAAVEIESGHSAPEKTLRIHGPDPDTIRRALAGR